MPATYESIATTTLGSAAQNIEFTSIPGTYTDLRIILTARGTSDALPSGLQFNGDTGTNYSRTRLGGDGTTASSARTANASYVNLAQYGLMIANPQLYIIDIFSYAGSTNKTCLLEESGDRNGAGQVQRQVGLWRNTNAITSIKLYTLYDQFASGTTATLYGILKA